MLFEADTLRLDMIQDIKQYVAYLILDPGLSIPSMDIIASDETLKMNGLISSSEKITNYKIAIQCNERLDNNMLNELADLGIMAIHDIDSWLFDKIRLQTVEQFTGDTHIRGSYYYYVFLVYIIMVKILDIYDIPVELFDK